MQHFIADPTSLFVLGDIFSEVNRLTSRATSTLQLVVAFLGIVAFLVISAVGKWRMNAVLMGVCAGGLLIWGAIAGVPWIADQAESTIGAAITLPGLTR